MQFEIKQRPDFSIAKVTFEQAGEEILLESAAMVARDSGVAMKTQMKGGMLAAAKRKMLGGESIFQNTFTASKPGETLWFAPGPDGDMEMITLDGTFELMMTSGAFVASAPSITLNTKFAGLKGFFSGTSLFMLKVEGQGPVFFGCYGGLHAIDVGPQGYIVDNNHIVAFTGGLDYKMRTIGGLMGFAASGEGIVCEFKGQGRVWISTRNPSGLTRFLHPFRPVKPSN